MPSRPRLFAAMAILGMAALVLAAAELIARVTFKGYAEDQEYVRLVLERLLNSGLVAENQGGDPSRFLAYTPHVEKTFEAPEYRYTVRTNSLGFRSREIEPPSADEDRLLLLGDSMFFGVGAEEDDTIAARLEQRSRQETALEKRRLAVFNFAVGGFNTAQEISVLRHFGETVRPSEVVLGFFVGNDFLTNAVAGVDAQGNYAVDDRKLQDLRETVRAEHAWLFAPSVVWRVLALNLYVPRLRYTLATAPEMMGRSLDLLRAARDDCRALGVPFLVVMVYPREGVQGGWRARWSGSRRAAQALIRRGRAEGIDILDLLTVMRGGTDAQDCYFSTDGHLNPAGNARVAAAIYGAIAKAHARGGTDR